MVEPMTFRRALGAIVASMAAGSGLGTCLGWLTALCTPGYYETVFARRNVPVDPVQVGVGLGLTQGALFGAICGVVVVALLTWQYVRASDRARRLS